MQAAQALRVSGHVRLATSSRGSSWYVKYRIGERQFQKRLGPAWEEKGRPPAGYYTRKTAEAALQALLTDARRGHLTPSPARSGATFADVAEDWLRYVEDDRKRRVSTVTDYRRLVDSALLPEFGHLPLEAMTVERIDLYRQALVREGRLSPRSINKRLRVLNGIFRRAMRTRGLATNPVALVERQPVRDSGDLAIYTLEEVEALARAASFEQEAALYRVAAYTGLRMGELRALRWENVDFAKQNLLVRRNLTYGHETTSKSGRIRSVPLSDQVIAALDGLSRRDSFTAPGDIVFCNEVGAPLDDSIIRRRFYETLKRAGLRRLRFHDLRHVFGTMAAQAFPVPDVQAMLGHADMATTQRYLHYTPNPDAAARLSKLFGATSPGKAARHDDDEGSPATRHGIPRTGR